MASRLLKGTESPANWARKIAGPLIVFMSVVPWIVLADGGRRRPWARRTAGGRGGDIRRGYGRSPPLATLPPVLPANGGRRFPGDLGKSAETRFGDEWVSTG